MKCHVLARTVALGLCVAAPAAALPERALVPGRVIRPVNPLTLPHPAHPANWGTMTAKQKQHWIEINSFSTGASNPAAMGRMAMKGGKRTKPLPAKSHRAGWNMTTNHAR